jgi:hypothetical protein
LIVAETELERTEEKYDHMRRLVIGKLTDTAFVIFTVIETISTVALHFAEEKILTKFLFYSTNICPLNFQKCMFIYTPLAASWQILCSSGWPLPKL